MLFEGKTLNGCGGDPADLLKGGEWVVEDITGVRLVDHSRITLAFGADGRVSGMASCNRYGAEYALTGEGLTISKGFTTRMACDPPLMNQEQVFLEVLSKVQRFELGPNGTLILHTADRRTITARRGVSRSGDVPWHSEPNAIHRRARGDVEHRPVVAPRAVAGSDTGVDRAEMRPVRREDVDAARSRAEYIPVVVDLETVGRAQSPVADRGGIVDHAALPERPVLVHVEGEPRRASRIDVGHEERLLVGREGETVRRVQVRGQKIETPLRRAAGRRPGTAAPSPGRRTSVAGRRADR